MKRGCLFTVAGGLAGLIALLVAAYLLMDREKQILNSANRAGLSGQFITLPEGVTHYQLTGPEDGPLVVCFPRPAEEAARKHWRHTGDGISSRRAESLLEGKPASRAGRR